MRLSMISTVAIGAVFLSACSVSTQNTSGRDYLSRYSTAQSQVFQSGQAGRVDQDVREIANIEPDLQFPARIGLARIDYGRLTTIPGDEALIWSDVAEQIGTDFGTFVPISPMIAASVARPNTPDMDASAAIVADIRRGAARQHVDYVIIYETVSQAAEKANALALADLTVIGWFVLPSRTVEVEASASALMLDVRNGYPYATLTAHAEKKGVSRAISERSTRQTYIDTAEERAVTALAAQFEDALIDLALASLREDS